MARAPFTAQEQDSPEFRMKNRLSPILAGILFKAVWQRTAQINVIFLKLVNSFFTLWTQVNICRVVAIQMTTCGIAVVTFVTVRLSSNTLNGELGEVQIAIPLVQDLWATGICSLSLGQFCRCPMGSLSKIRNSLALRGSSSIWLIFHGC